MKWYAFMHMKYTKICFSLLVKANSDVLHNLVIAVEFPCVSYMWYFWYILYIIHGLVAPPLICDKTFRVFLLPWQLPPVTVDTMLFLSPSLSARQLVRTESVPCDINNPLRYSDLHISQTLPKTNKINKVRLVTFHYIWTNTTQPCYIPPRSTLLQNYLGQIGITSPSCNL